MTWLKGWAANAVVWAIAVLGFVGTALLALARRDARVRKETIQEGIADASERVEKGRGAVADGRERGNADDRVQHNDAAW